MLSSKIVLDTGQSDGKRAVVLLTTFKGTTTYVAIAVDGRRRCVGSSYSDRSATARALVRCSDRRVYTEVEATCELALGVVLH